MKRLASFFGLLVGAACLLLFLKAASSHWDAFRLLPADARTIIGIGLALAFYLLTYLLGSRSWQLMLQIMGVALPYRRSLEIVATSQIGKYLPGNVGQHLGRLLLARKSGIEMGKAAASIALEPPLLVVGAGICALFALELFPRISSLYGWTIQRNILALLAIVSVTLVLALFIPKIREKVVPLVAKSRFLLSTKSLGLSTQAVVIHVCSFGLGSISLWLVVGVMSHQYQAFPLSLLGIYAIAWLVGFVVPGAPAGLGVREALLVFGLTPLYGGEVAATGTALFRLITVLGDGITYLLGLGLRRMPDRTNLR